MVSVTTMPPEDSQRLEACLLEAAEILYQNTPAEEMTNFESLEKVLRTTMLEQVSPKIAFFYQTSHRHRKRQRKSSQEYCGQGNSHRTTSKNIGIEAL